MTFLHKTEIAEFINKVKMHIGNSVHFAVLYGRNFENIKKLYKIQKNTHWKKS